MGELEIKVVRVNFASMFKIYILRQVSSGTKFYYDFENTGPDDGIFVPAGCICDEGGFEPSPAIMLPMHFASKLITEFSNNYVKPEEEIEIKATLKAKESHLEDTKKQLDIMTDIVKSVVNYEMNRG